jgi:hypothetical protein
MFAKGRNRLHGWAPESRAKVSQFMKGNTFRLGTKLSQEHKESIRKASLGNTYYLKRKTFKRTTETKEKIRLSWIVRRAKSSNGLGHAYS